MRSIYVFLFILNSTSFEKQIFKFKVKFLSFVDV